MLASLRGVRSFGATLWPLRPRLSCRSCSLLSLRPCLAQLPSSALAHSKVHEYLALKLGLPSSAPTKEIHVPFISGPLTARASTLRCPGLWFQPSLLPFVAASSPASAFVWDAKGRVWPLSLLKSALSVTDISAQFS